MLKTKSPEARLPLAVHAVRLVHVLLAGYAVAILVIGSLLPGYPETLTESSSSWISREQLFSAAVGIPLLLASIFCLLSLFGRTLFTAAVFFSLFTAAILVSLPMMTRVSFPDHLWIFGLAAVYGLSSFTVIRFWLSQPVLKRP